MDISIISTILCNKFISNKLAKQAGKFKVNREMNREIHWKQIIQ